ncbi:MAG: ACT domain-containing protein [Verrucomicrobiota bacterium]
MMNTVLELTVRNHPGAMMHVCSLFARRAYNVDGILCMPTVDESRSRMWLRVVETDRMPQVIANLSKLEDVYTVREHGASHEVFAQLEIYFKEGAEASVDPSI